MANKPICMEILEQIKILNSLGVGKKAIAKQLGISKNTVKSYLDQPQAAQLNSIQQEEKLSELYKFFPYCKEELQRTGVTRLVLWGEYRAKNQGGYSYTRFCEHFAT